MSAESEAIRFLQCFPDSQSFTVLVLTSEKKALISRPQASLTIVHQELPQWLRLPGVHIFIRPNLSNLCMIDLDNYAGSMEQLFALQPRALTRTSVGSLQMWLVLPEHMPGKAALSVTKALTKALAGDPASAKEGQLGRLPGSVNVKPGKGCRVELLHGCLQDMCEPEYLKCTSEKALSLGADGALTVRERPAKRALTPCDRSAADWSKACAFFEANPEATEEKALATLEFSARRPNQAYYNSLTVSNARKHVLGLGSSDSRGSASNAKCASSAVVVQQQEPSRVIPSVDVLFCAWKQHIV